MHEEGVRIAVAIPVGPKAVHGQWLQACLDSIGDQDRKADDLILVDDMHGLEGPPMAGSLPGITYRTPWNLGVVSSFNIGIAVALRRKADLVVMIGADDKMRPEALGRLEETYLKADRADGYYWFAVEYSTGYTQRAACHEAAVTKGLMELTGGFDPRSEGAAPDACFISMLMVHHPSMLREVETRGFPIWHRVHDGQETKRRTGVDLQVRGTLTETWEPPEWGRMWQ